MVTVCVRNESGHLPVVVVKLTTPDMMCKTLKHPRCRRVFDETQSVGIHHTPTDAYYVISYTTG